MALYPHIADDLLTPEEESRALAAAWAGAAEGAGPVARPALHWITGQAGSGKSHLAARLWPALAAAPGGCARLEFDRLRAHHPRHAALLAADPATANLATDEACWRLMQALLARIAAARLNLLLDDAAMGADETRALLAPFAAGHAIAITVLAVPPGQCHAAISARHQAGAGHWVDGREQAEGFDRLLASLRALAGLDVALRLVTRDGALVHEGPAGAADALSRYCAAAT